MEEKDATANGVLDLLLDQSVRQQSAETADDERIIYEYEDAKVIGAKILEDFLKFYDKRSKSFPLDDKNVKRKSGTITNIMALSTLLEIKSLGVDMTSCEKIYYETIEKVFANIYRGDSTVFDAAPYWDDDSYHITTYVETASKLISTLVDLRDDLLRMLYSEKKKIAFPNGITITVRGQVISDASALLACTEQLILDAANMLNEAALPIDHPYAYTVDGKKTQRPGVGNMVICRGWAFQKPGADNAADYEMSLYYTYYGTNAFISVYNSMEDYYEYLDNGTELFANLEKSTLSAEDGERYFKFCKDGEFYRNNSAILDRMRELTASAGRHIETILRRNNVNIAFDYVDKSLRPVSLETIEKGANNHIMNSLFAFAALINAGVDDDYASVGKSSIFQTIQFALTNIKKIYLAFRDDRREDLIETFSLGEDKCPAEVSMIMQSWRRSGSISTYDLVPLYCNTYNLVSNYVIRYPQKEMRENLVWLLENKSPNGWYWTKEGFSINNNLYYIYALDSFYSYYKRYEEGFLKADDLRISKEREIKRLKDSAKKELEATKEKYERTIEEIRNERSPLVAELEKFVGDALEKQFPALFERTLGEYVDAGLDFALRAVDGGLYVLDEMRREFYENKKLQLIFTASSLELIGSGKDMNVSDVEADRKKERLRDALYRKILNALCHD